jgi:hypothetical protein
VTFVLFLGSSVFEQISVKAENYDRKTIGFIGIIQKFVYSNVALFAHLISRAPR